MLLFHILGVLLADPPESCEEFCRKNVLENVGFFACYPKLKTKDSSDLFESAGMECRDKTSQSQYSKGYHPSYNSKEERCEGFVGVPKEINCSAPSKADTHRLCYCVSPCEYFQ